MNAAQVWDAGREPGREVLALGSALALTGLAAELWLAGEVAWFSDLVFVVACALAALRVHPRDFFGVGVMPPMLLLGLMTLAALADRGAVARPGDSLVQAIVSGLAHHSPALVLGYLAALGTLAYRRYRLETAGGW